MSHKKVLFLLLILPAFSWLRVNAQVWEVPPDKKGEVAPYLFTPDMQKLGENLYIKNCQSCHGMPGKDNWAKLTPPPGDLGKEKAQQQSDGELFYKITAGKTPMPEFKNILTVDDRWHVIAYVRTFNPAYVQPDPAAKAGFAGKRVKLLMHYDTTGKRVVVTALEITKEKAELPLQGAEIMLYVKRYFGNMLLDEPRKTNEKGIAFFQFPADLPGDQAGKVELSASINDPSGQLSEARVQSEMAIAKPTEKPGLRSERAWWNTRDMAPLWLIITYSLAVIITWSVIIYIIISILKIQRIKS
jgi:mono/diheme cytochrome c family protein